MYSVMTQKELQDIYDKLCDDFEKANNDPDSPYAAVSAGWLLDQYEVTPGMTFRDAFNMYMSLMHNEEGWDFYNTFPGDDEDGRLFQNLITLQGKRVPTDVFEFEEEE